MSNQSLGKLRLHTILVVPFVLQIIAAVGLVGYLSFRSGQQAVNNLANQLMEEIDLRIQREVSNYLAVPQQVQKMNLQAIKAGEINIKDFDRLGKIFWNQAQSFGFIYLGLGTVDKEYVGAGYFEGKPNVSMLIKPRLDDFLAYEPDELGNPKRQPVYYEGAGADYFETEPWFRETVAAGKSIWGSLYNWQDAPEQISMSFGSPIFSQSGQLEGTIGIDVSLSQLNTFLRSLQIGKTGKAFIMERSGRLVATSSSAPSYKVINAQAEQLQAIESSEPLIQSAAIYLAKDGRGLELIQTPQRSSYVHDGKNNFLFVTPYKDEYGLDWLIAIVVPESDFTEQINQNTRNTIYLSLASLATAIALGVITARWITRPIQRVSQAAEDVAKGELDRQVNASRIVEINTLATSFNSMAKQLKESFNALQVAEGNYRGIFENALEGIFQSTPNGRFLSVNPAMARIYGYDSPDEMMAAVTHIGEQLYVNSFERNEFLRLMQKQGYVRDFEHQSYRKDKSVIWVQIGARAVQDSEGQVQYYEGIVQDITHQKRQKEILETMVEERTADLAEANQEISSLNQKLQSENLRMGAELSVVRRLQQMVLPKEEELNQIAELDIAGFMQPADEVGGDYYDVLHRNGLVKIGIGDVTGHGLESGMLMLMTQTAIRTLLEHQEVDSIRFFNTVNRVIYENANRMDCSKNLTLSLLDYQNGQIKVSGYHEDVIVVRSTGEIERIDTVLLGLPIGLEADISAFIAQANIQLNPQDVVVLYTDGITEAKNRLKHQYGVDRLCAIVCQHRDQSAHDIRQAVIDDVQRHLDSQPIQDDITLLILKQR